MWNKVTDGLPDKQDRKARRRYMVYAPSFGGAIFRCWFRSGWGCDDVGSMVSGVTHYRVAKLGERKGQLSPAEIAELESA